MKRIVATAPGRCGIVGNPTDMYGGSVISCSTKERAKCLLKEAATGIRIVNDDEGVLMNSKNDLVFRNDKLDIVRAALIYFEIDPANTALEIEVSTQIPMRAGLAGSTAMLAAIVGAFDSWLSLRLSPYHLAETMRKIEDRIMKVTCGFQDQHMAIFGGLNFMDFAGKESLSQAPDEPLATIESLSAFVPAPPFLLAHTGVQHHSGTVHASPRERWLKGETLVRNNYSRIAELARSAKRAIVEGDWAKVGALMNENHALVAVLGGSGPDNERLISAALKAGALGAKLAGAGGGGTIIALTHEPEKLGNSLLAAGADGLYFPSPQPGLQVFVE